MAFRCWSLSAASQSFLLGLMRARTLHVVCTAWMWNVCLQFLLFAHFYFSCFCSVRLFIWLRCCLLIRCPLFNRLHADFSLSFSFTRSCYVRYHISCLTTAFIIEIVFVFAFLFVSISKRALLSFIALALLVFHILNFKIHVVIGCVLCCMMSYPVRVCVFVFTSLSMRCSHIWVLSRVCFMCTNLHDCFHKHVCTFECEYVVVHSLCIVPMQSSFVSLSVPMWAVCMCFSIYSIRWDLNYRSFVHTYANTQTHS